MACILVIDDDAEVRGVLRRMLERAGYVVAQADLLAAVQALLVGE
jgi:CheY-like chemotaxis protein